MTNRDAFGRGHQVTIPPVMRNLSKSKILAYRQCPKRLWLEVNKPELRDDSASQVVFAIGYQVGDVARSLYDPDGTGTTVDIEALGHSDALKLSAGLLQIGAAPIFEAGLTIPGALAYADVMLPEHSDGSLRWHMVEVKSSGSVKNYQQDDLAVQVFIATEAGVPLASASLAHIDTSFVYHGDGNYHGLLCEVDLTETAMARAAEVREWFDGAHTVARMETEPEIATGPHCKTPFACGFCDYCNQGKNEIRPEYPLSSLPRLHASRRGRIEAEGYEDLREVPDDFLNYIQARVKQCSVTGEPYFNREGAAAALAPHGFPAYFLDFETIAFVVPTWIGTRPYQQIPFQFSLHRLAADGELDQVPFLDLSGDDPSLALAQALVAACGTDGPVFAYNAGFESRVIRELAERLPDLAQSLLSIDKRLVDLLPVARSHYYHPSQHGSWSIKAVLPALCPDLCYSSLNGVQNGGMAQEAYLEAIAPEAIVERKKEIERELLDYCHLDTLAMVRMWNAFTTPSTSK